MDVAASRYLVKLIKLSLSIKRTRASIKLITTKQRVFKFTDYPSRKCVDIKVELVLLTAQIGSAGMAGSLSEYELLRLRNIKRNHEFMKSLGEYNIF